MIFQTCQRCGHVFLENLEGGAATLDMRRAVTADLWIGMWTRQFVLCDSCAVELQDWIFRYFGSANRKGRP